MRCSWVVVALPSGCGTFGQPLSYFWNASLLTDLLLNLGNLSAIVFIFTFTLSLEISKAMFIS